MEIEIGKIRKDITTNALRHYVDVLKKIEESEYEDIILATYQLKEDLKNEQKNAEEILESLQKNEFDTTDPDGNTIRIFKMDSMRNTITTALLYYYHGMVQSSQIVSELLIKPNLPLLKTEIEYCKEFLNHLHTKYELDTEIS